MSQDNEFDPQLAGEVAVIALDKFEEVREEILAFACRIANFSREYPDAYNGFILNSPENFGNTGQEHEIFKLDPNFPGKNFIDPGTPFSYEMLIAELDDTDLMTEDGTQATGQGIIGLNIHAENGSSFAFYLYQLADLIGFCEHYMSHHTQEIPAGFTIGDLN